MIIKEKYLKHIPKEMRKYKQWILFKKIRNIDKFGKEKIIKLPLSPITGKSSEWNNKDNWTSFEKAIDIYMKVKK